MRIKAYQTKSRILQDSIAIVSALSLFSLFFEVGRIRLGTGNLIPWSLVLMVVLLVTVIPAKGLQRQTKIRFPIELSFGLLMFSMFALSDVWHGTLSTKIMAYLKLFSLVGWTFLIVNIVDKHNLKLFLRLLVLMGFVLSILALASFFVSSNKEYINLFEGDLRGRNGSSYVLLLFISMLAPYVILDSISNGLERYLLFNYLFDRIILFIFVLSVLLTYSRGAFISMTAALIGLILFNRRSKISRKIMSILFLVLLFVAALWIASSWSIGIVDRLVSITAFSPEESQEEFASNATRITLGRVGMRMVTDSPWLGFGLRGFQDNFTGYIRDGDFFGRGRDTDFGSPHIQYIDIAVQGGIFALLLFLMMLKRFLVAIVKIIRNPNINNPMILIVAFGWSMHILYFFFEWPLQRLLFWTFLALSIVIISEETTENPVAEL